MVSRLLCLSLMVAVASAATWMGRLPMKPRELAHKQGCYVKEINDVIPFGEDITPEGYCYRIECSRHMMYYASCGSVSTLSTDDYSTCYKKDVDYSRPYPECCPTIVCDIDNNVL